MTAASAASRRQGILFGILGAVVLDAIALAIAVFNGQDALVVTLALFGPFQLAFQLPAALLAFVTGRRAVAAGLLLATIATFVIWGAIFLFFVYLA